MTSMANGIWSNGFGTERVEKRREGSVLELLKANMLAHFAYYRRSRLLQAFLLVFLLMTGMNSLPPLFYDSGVENFNTLQATYASLNWFLLFFAGGLSLFIISSHLRNRSLKMVFTKPCSPALWLGSTFLSAITVSLLLNVVIFASAMSLSLIWHLPVRTALLFISLDTFIASVAIIAYLMLLTTLVHPAIAATLALIFNASLFYDAQFWAESVVRSGNPNLFLRVLDRLFQVLYLLAPMVHAFDNKTEGIYTSLRVAHGDWKYILYSLGYTSVLSVFCYLLALFALLRKQHT